MQALPLHRTPPGPRPQHSRSGSPAWSPPGRGHCSNRGQSQEQQLASVHARAQAGRFRRNGERAGMAISCQRHMVASLAIAYPGADFHGIPPQTILRDGRARHTHSLDRSCPDDGRLAAVWPGTQCPPRLQVAGSADPGRSCRLAAVHIRVQAPLVFRPLRIAIGPAGADDDPLLLLHGVVAAGPSRGDAARPRTKRVPQEISAPVVPPGKCPGPECSGPGE